MVRLRGNLETLALKELRLAKEKHPEDPEGMHISVFHHTNTIILHKISVLTSLKS